MCVTSAAAALTSTYVGAWEIEHPEYGYRHVMAYQNAPQNLAEGANCMLLHIPAAAPLLPEHLLDTADCPDLLRQTYQLWMSRNTRGGLFAQSIYVVEMGVYHVVLLNEKTEDALNAALLQIPLEKRPAIAPELLHFYADNFPGYPLVLACFNNKDSRNASPILLHYQPYSNTELFFNLLEGHDGAPPVLGKIMNRHQVVIAGTQRVETWRGHPGVFEYPGVPERLLPFLPVVGEVQALSGESPNNDAFWSLVD